MASYYRCNTSPQTWCLGAMHVSHHQHLKGGRAASFWSLSYRASSLSLSGTQAPCTAFPSWFRLPSSKPVAQHLLSEFCFPVDMLSGSDLPASLPLGAFWSVCTFPDIWGWCRHFKILNISALSLLTQSLCSQDQDAHIWTEGGVFCPPGVAGLTLAELGTFSTVLWLWQAESNPGFF